jgi:hypothetical protein
VLAAVAKGDWEAELRLASLTDESAFEHPSNQAVGGLLLRMTALTRVDISPTNDHFGRWEVSQRDYQAVADAMPEVLGTMRQELGVENVYPDSPFFPGVNDTDIISAIIDGSLRLGTPYAAAPTA